MKIKPIAIHLPQFHPFKENDEWWGKGFTEWTNVTKAKPLFEDHYQPHLPADLGFYDLRLAEARLAQIELAKAYDIYGFCYYHYWFNGKRLMTEPLDGMLKNAKEDFPFMLCWANENWTRTWDGMDKQVLIEQTYNKEDDYNHIDFLLNHFFIDDRYIKVNGKPIYVIYRPQLFPNIKETLKNWRLEAKKRGFPDLYLGYFQSFGFKEDPISLGFDFAIDFQPDFSNAPTQEFAPLPQKIKAKLGLGKSAYHQHKIMDYKKFVAKQQTKGFQNFVYPAITPMWDNTPRRKTGGHLFKESSPAEYGKWLQHIKEEFKWETQPEPFLFINAWNEWAEGNHLEPCKKWGLQYLEKTKEILSKS